MTPRRRGTVGHDFVWRQPSFMSLFISSSKLFMIIGTPYAYDVCHVLCALRFTVFFIYTFFIIFACSIFLNPSGTRFDTTFFSYLLFSKMFNVMKWSDRYFVLAVCRTRHAYRAVHRKNTLECTRNFTFRIVLFY